MSSDFSAPSNSRSPLPGRAAKPVGSLSFEKALGEIELIIERIEAGEIGLEESLAQYERGVLLVNHCRGRLDAAQQQVEDLTRKLERADEEAPGARGSGGAGPSPNRPGDPDDDDPEL